MKITGKKTVVLCTVISLIAFGSCQMFTTSLGKGFARDQTKQLAKASSAELADALATPKDSKTATAILEVLATKDTAEIQALSNEQKAAVLNTALDASVTIQDLKDQASALLGEGDTDTNQIITNICNAVNPVNTAAIVAILSGDTSSIDASSLANASLALVAQVAKATDVTQVMENFEGVTIDSSTDIDNTVNQILKGTDATEETKANLKAALNTMVELNERPKNEEIKVLGILDISELLNSLNKA